MEKQHETVEIPWKNPEQILSDNAFRVLKVLIQLEKTKPNKVKVKDIWRIINNLGKSKIYECLKELENKGFVEHKQPYYSLKGIRLSEKRILLETEEPIPILLALMIKKKYPNVEIRTKKKSVWRRIRDFLTEPSIPIIEF